MNNDYQNMELGLQYLKTQGINTKNLEEVVRQQKSQALGNSMSTTDGVYITQATPDVPGVYEDQYQKAQDAYSKALAMQEQRNESPTPHQQFIPEIADISMGNPNYRTVAGPQRVTIGSNGQLIYL